MYRFGLSATPDRGDGWWPVVKSLLGPIIYDLGVDDVSGYVMTPSVYIAKSDFKFGYRPTVKNDKGVVVKRNNYAEMMNHLILDQDRNDLIARHILAATHRPTLVLSRRIQHLKEIAWRIEGERFIYMLTGRESDDRRREIRETISTTRDVVVLSTIGDEGLDLPEIEVLVLAYPTSKLSLLEQQIGRVRRTAPNKAACVVIDISDRKVPVLANRAWGRQKLYVTQKMEVKL
jgi:superfamily II DNA or RNA helicase